MKNKISLLIFFLFTTSICIAQLNIIKLNSKYDNLSKSKEYESNCKQEALDYVRMLCKESGDMFDKDKIELSVGLRTTRKISDREYAVQIYYPNRKGLSKEYEEVVKVDSDCNIISSRRRKKDDDRLDIIRF